MGWFEKQVQQREDLDRQLFEDSFFNVAGIVMGDRKASQYSDERIITGHAIEEILKYYHCKPVEVPKTIRDPEEYIDYCLRPHGLMRRDINLDPGWYRDSFGPVLAFLKDSGDPVAVFPGKIGGYRFTDPETGRTVRLNRKTEELLKDVGYCFYSPLPQRKIGIRDLLLYMKRCVTPCDAALIVIATLAVTLIGMVIPRVTKALTGPIVTNGTGTMLISVAICLLCTSLAYQLISALRGMYMSRIQSKATLGIQASMMMRVMSLPADFFRRYSPGELTNRSMSVNDLCNMLLGTVMSTSLTSLMSLLYITQIFSFTPALVVPSLLIILVTVVFSTVE